ncbi:MAG: hypothetical protein AB1449_12840 [Chloroflexota bacterium]
MTGRRKRRGSLPVHRWPLWKVVAAGLFWLLWSALPLLIPPYVPGWALVACGALFFAMFGATLWVYFRDNLWARSTLGFSAFPGVFTLMTSRAWLFALPISWQWLLPLWGAVVVAALLPFTAPKLSRVLWTEQTAPRTRLGRALMALLLVVGPSAGTLGAAWGMYGSRFLGQQPTMLGMAVLGSMMAVGCGFVASYNVVLWKLKEKSASSQTR